MRTLNTVTAVLTALTTSATPVLSNPGYMCSDWMEARLFANATTPTEQQNECVKFVENQVKAELKGYGITRHSITFRFQDGVVMARCIKQPSASVNLIVLSGHHKDPKEACAHLLHIKRLLQTVGS